jgi:hypothetical protein
LRTWAHPSLSKAELRALNRIQRLAASPATVAATYQIIASIDLRPVLPAVRVPTLVLHRRDDRFLPIGNGRYLAEHIEGARFVPLEGADSSLVVGGSAEALDEIQEFLTGVRPPPEPDRVLATLLFTDIVGSTDLAARLGDRKWHALLDQHHQLVREQLSRFRAGRSTRQGTAFSPRSTAPPGPSAAPPRSGTGCAV